MVFFKKSTSYFVNKAEAAALGCKVSDPLSHPSPAHHLIYLASQVNKRLKKPQASDVKTGSVL
ncbi:hypothetical protein [Pseudomonas guariconensis]|uniref:hypothetical protein n=1 Tax=Pseudomonas guariconensis TaxID=1288410 RepID=UPI0018AC4EF0|nr:hypothetical protein [Pseudomonas guariconensis]MBF8751082.1 hypothetical protein [Pseudomonas guariconensis]